MACRLPTILCAMLYAVPCAAQTLPPRLVQAKALLERPEEAQVNEGAAICREANSVQAVEVLLETFNETRRRSVRYLDPAHYRDIVWDALAGIKDFYAQQRVEHELRTNGRNAFVRQWCAELLGIYKRPDFVDSLVKALRDKDAGVQRWAARSLGMIGHASAAKALQPLARSTDPYVRANAIEALARIDLEAHGPLLVYAISDDRDGGVRCALLGAVPSIYKDRVEQLSAARLTDADWRPRMQAIDNLADIKTKTCIDELLTVVDDERPVVAERAITVLQKLTGQQLRQPEIWRKWWKENRETFAFPEGERRAQPTDHTTVASFNGIQVTSDHVAFLIDKSIQMGTPLRSRNKNKEEAAREELASVFDKLHGKLVFNVFTYAVDIEVFAKKPIKVSKKAAARAIAFVDKQKKGRAKDIWQVLLRVIDDPTLDTAYLLSSGEPDIGTYVHWNRVTRHLKDLNRFHKVTVHTIAYSDNKWFRDQLEKIAEATGGEFRWFE